MKKIYMRLAASALLGLFLICSASAFYIINKELKFKKGSSATTIKDSVSTGTQHRYEFIANGGQNLTVAISSPQNNAVFQLYFVSPYALLMLIMMTLAGHLGILI
jgi:hypothetical protein